MLQLNSPTTVVRITSIDEKVFTARYHARCMECGFCNDLCCSFGCPVDLTEVDRIMQYRDEIEERIRIPSSEWFSDDVEYSDGFPSEQIRRTKVVDNACVFRDKVGRGCHLHRLALEKGIDPHDIKPLICFLFPLTWDSAHLYVSEFLDELPCCGAGESILDSQIPEIRLYLGEEFLREISSLGLSAGYRGQENNSVTV